MPEYRSQGHVVCEDVIVSDCELNSRCQTVRFGCLSGGPFIVKGCDGLVFKGVIINGQTYPDGPISGEPGDAASLERV